MSSIIHDENGDAQNATNQRMSKLEAIQANVRGQLQRQQRSVLGTIQPKVMAAGGHRIPPPFQKVSCLFKNLPTGWSKNLEIWKQVFLDQDFYKILS